MNCSRTLFRIRFSVFLLIVTAVVAYSGSFFNEFTFDDHMVLIYNHYIKNFANLPRLFTDDYFIVSKERTFRPIAPLTLFFEYQLFGFKPFYYHVVSVVMHLINSLLIFRLLIIVRHGVSAAFLAGLMFLIQPAISEVTFNMSYMEDLWGLLFFLIPFVLYFSFYGRHRVWMFVVMHACYFLSLMSKEMGIFFPAVIGLVSWAYYGEKLIDRKKVLRVYLPGFITAALYLYIRFFVIYLPEKAAPYPEGGIFVTLINIPRILFHYISLLFYPIILTADYEFALYGSPLRLPVLLCFAGTALLIYSLFKLPVRLAVWVLFFLIHFAPISTIYPFGNTIAERYLYFSAMGFAVFAGILIGDIFLPRLKTDHRKKVYCNVSIYGITFIFIILMIRLIVRGYDWKDDDHLWTAIERSVPKNFKNKATFLVNFGNVHLSKGDYQKAMKYYLAARDLNPYNTGVYNNLGIVYMRQGHYELAKSEFIQALSIDPQFLDTYFSLGNLYLLQNNLNAAEELMRKVLEIDPQNVQAYTNLGVIMSRRGSHQQSIDNMMRILRIDPKNENAYVNCAYAYSEMKDYKKAEMILQSGIHEIPGSTIIRISLAQLYLIMTDYKTALDTIMPVVAENPNDSAALAVQGGIYFRMGDYDNAQAGLLKSLSMNPEQPSAWYIMGIIYAETGKKNLARAAWEKSLSYNPNQPHIHDYLKNLE
ncbi:tetratricopeptide repeat protein [bacterium]|nr:tetratricopeptide repeat protein [bacterium]